MFKLSLKTGDKINITNNAPLSYRKYPLDEATAYSVTENDIKVMTDNAAVQFLKGKIQPLKDVPTREPRQMPKHIEVKRLKKQLADTDYKVIKYTEGYYTDAEFAPIKAEREAIRENIRKLESEIK